MPSPSQQLSTLRPDLASSLEDFDLMADAQHFIGQKIFPVLEVDRASGTFGRIPLEHLLQERETARAPGGGYNRGNWKFEEETYVTKENGWEEPVDDNEAEMYRDYFDAEAISTARAQRIIVENREKRIAAAVFDPATWTGANLTTGVMNEWDDAVNATPIEDVEAAVRKVYGNCGLWANALVINRLVFRNLRLCEQIIERVSASGSGDRVRAQDITEAQLAACFDLDHVLVAGGSKNTAKEGKSATISQIWSDEYAMVCRIAETPDVREPCIGRTFNWAGDGGDFDGRVETYRDETVRADIIRVRHQTCEKMLYKEAGHLLSNITA